MHWTVIFVCIEKSDEVALHYDFVKQSEAEAQIRPSLTAINSIFHIYINI